MSHIHYQELDKTPANHIALSPISFIKRAATYFSDMTSVIYHKQKFTWKQTYQRSCQLAHALHKQGIKIGDTVSALSPNTPALIEAHYGVAMAGAVLNTINMRLDNNTIGYILQHSDCKLLLVDAQFIEMATNAIEQNNLSITVIRIDDLHENISSPLGDMEYEAFIAQGESDYLWQMPEDEWQAIALNYTSGTSGKPKGVVYHHRGSYLMSMGSVAAWQMPMHPKYLYTVPLFHCNGWGYIWTIALLGGTFVCVRNISTELIFNHIAQHKITHFGGAPIILGMLVNADENEKIKIKHLDYQVKVMTAGAPPPAPILASMAAMNFQVMQVYGLTETYGHISHCLWRQKWDKLTTNEQAEIQSWQGMSFPMNEEIGLMDKNGNLIPYSPSQQEQNGEIVIRGNTVMKGYYKNPEATEKAFDGGWFHSEDIAIWQEDSYLQVKDRLKDIIISGGENISSVEVEGILYKHPAVAYAAVVAQEDDKWGEIPAAFIELKKNFENAPPSLQEIQDFCRQHLSSFKIPKAVKFEELPKTATGKIQKFKLRSSIK
jgi:fatty-acyl-CoA synthase